ncbi:MAG: hypothetical protein KatS3mg027_1408 [Bacteroidia bacterium]|nr:MAG: hypothetical protein KatS3mg027_1408 [Bacteroidia bacterium]
MRYTNKLIISLFILFTSSILGQNNSLSREEEDKRANTPVPFTLGDRDRILKMEFEITELREEMLLRFENQQQQLQAMEKNNQERLEALEKKYDLMFSILYGLIIAMFGYIIWDRRSFLKPLEKIVQKLMYDTENIKTNQEKFDNLINALKELAKTDENVKKVLQQFHLL